MNIPETKKKANASEDLTVVFLKGNGAPRSFRISLNHLYRSLTAIGFTFATALLATVFFIGFSFVQSWKSSPSVRVLVQTVTATAPSLATSSESSTAQTTVTETKTQTAAATEITKTLTQTVTQTATVTEAAKTEDKTGLWQRIGAISGLGPSETEMKKEIAGLREDNAKLNSKLDGRKNIVASGAPSQVVQLLGSRSEMVAEGQSFVKIRNPQVTKDKNNLYLSFELQNTDPAQKQERGYIVVLAKSSDMVYSYPAGAFSPRDNILLNYTKGETFGISRFREAKADFPLKYVDGKVLDFQILLFNTEGKIISNLHVEHK